MNGTEITVAKVDKGTELAAKLLDFVEHFSWEELRAHTAKRIRDWEFRGWETPFAALAGERIVGMATISERLSAGAFPLDLHRFCQRGLPGQADQ